METGGSGNTAGPDLSALLTGSEGTLGIVTEVLVRLTPLPLAVTTLLAGFRETREACLAVSAIIRAGIVPATLELMDEGILSAVEQNIHYGFPEGARAVLLIEMDGPSAGLQRQADRVRDLCREQGAGEVRTAKDEHERERLWAGRKKAGGSIGRLAPGYCTQDCVVPRSKLPEVFEGVYEIVRRHGLKVGNVAHAGDGNLHPMVMFDDRDPREREAIHRVSEEIVRLCVQAGGTITGEHGVGLEKRDFLPWMFSEEDLNVMRSIRKAFDPALLCNPGKIFPEGKGERTP
jgi:FAD/FMN-containing dehydrogenase